jgi:FAD/FMN-containing dehydrogenase
VLSVGGIGGTSYHCGAVVDNVLELQVVTGAGQLETCSPTHQRQLFESVLAGLGQYGIIVKATLRLVPAQTHARTFHLSYPDLATCMRDERLLLDGERFDSLVGYIVPSPFGTWDYILEATRFYTPTVHQPDNDHLLQGLSFIPGMEQIEDMSYLAFSSRVATQVEGLKAMGGWDLSHPWFDVFVPGSEVEQYVSETLAEISPIDFGFSFILFNGLRSNCFHTPLLRIPVEETFFLFDIFRTAIPNSDTLTNALTHNRKLMERNHALGGKCYPIGTHEFSPVDWKTQYGSSWETLQRAKEHFDPDNVLTPGQGIFPSS